VVLARDDSQLGFAVAARVLAAAARFSMEVAAAAAWLTLTVAVHRLVVSTQAGRGCGPCGQDKYFSKLNTTARIYDII